jgi:phenylacetate-coenzyme A ligase PaaK-like adenylate-forming protein
VPVRSPISEDLKQRILNCNDQHQFNALALEIFRLQAEHNPVYREFLSLLGRKPEDIHALSDIPFLPVSFFKTHKVSCIHPVPEKAFTSSGTTGEHTSFHHYSDDNFYLSLATRLFEKQYGPIREFTILALLPGYLERSGSSLITMTEHFIRQAQPESGFYLDKLEELSECLVKLQSEKRPVLLLGVTHALLDLAEKFPVFIPDIIIMETGGMKGKRKEITRKEVHEKLCAAFGSSHIHSEYGMTELFSQAYSKGDGIFESSSTLRILIRETTDPFHYCGIHKTGAINIIDLGNAESCSFIAVDDLGKIHADGRFEVLGRMDNSDIRGCNLLVQ